MRIALGALALVASFACPAAAADYWAVSAKPTEGIAIDKSTVRNKGGGNHAMWLITVRDPEPVIGDKSAFYTLAQIEVSCSEEVTRALYVAGYAKEGGLVFSGDAGRETEPIIPGSTGAIIFDAICQPAARLSKSDLYRMGDHSASYIAEWLRNSMGALRGER